MPQHAEIPSDPIVYLHINEGMVTSQKVIISTVLGSCVAVTFYHRPSKLSGIFHASLPSKKRFHGVSNQEGDSDYRYVDSAIETILQQFLSHGIGMNQIEAKLFGGAYSMADKVQSMPDVRRQVDVGRQNVEVAQKTLAEHHLPVQAEDILGRHGRRILFSTATGDVWRNTLHG